MKSQGPPGPRPEPRPPKVRERSSLQTKARGVSERVRLLEDILVAYIKAHGDLIKYLTSERVRSQLLNAVKAHKKAKEIMTSAFKEVDRAAGRHRAMLKRMQDINDEETSGATFPSLKDVGEKPPFSSIVTEGKDVFIPPKTPLNPHGLTEDEIVERATPIAQAAMNHVHETEKLFAAGTCPTAAQEEAVLKAKQTETDPKQTETDPKQTETDEKLVTFVEKDSEFIESGPHPAKDGAKSAEKPADSPSVRAFKDSMIGKEP